LAGWPPGSFAQEAEKRKQEIEEQRGIQIELVDGDQLAAMIVEGGLRAVGFSESNVMTEKPGPAPGLVVEALTKIPA
jgi:hypothetical protein